MKRILIAEDDEVIREALKKLLRANGYAVTEELPCDLALLDINLPGESGYALCEKIKRSAAVPVIFLTARDGVGDELAGFCAGGDDYIKSRTTRTSCSRASRGCSERTTSSASTA